MDLISSFVSESINHLLSIGWKRNLFLYKSHLSLRGENDSSSGCSSILQRGRRESGCVHTASFPFSSDVLFFFSVINQAPLCVCSPVWCLGSIYKKWLMRPFGNILFRNKFSSIGKLSKYIRSRKKEWPRRKTFILKFIIFVSLACFFLFDILLFGRNECANVWRKFT